MVTSIIVINQVGKPPGDPGVSRDDLALSDLVTLSNYDDTGVLFWNWRILARPSGSTAHLETPTSSTSTFTPDLAGSYLIRLLVNGRTSSTIIAAVKTSTLAMRIPASGETTEFGGWELAMQTILGQIEAALASGGPVPNHATRHENGGIDEVNVAGLSGLLADSQTPLSHNTSHKNGGSDEVATATPAANAIPKADAGGKLDSWISNAGASTPGLMEINTDLGGTYTAPQVIGLKGYTLPAMVASNYLKVNSGANGWEFGTGGGAAAFTDLTDTPSDYSGHGGEFVAVNVGESALEFVASPGGAVAFTDLTDTPSSYVLGDVGKIVAVNATHNGLEFINPPSGGGGGGSFFQSDDEYSEAGSTFVTIGTFRLFIPTEVPITNFILVCSGWRDTAGTCEVKVQIGVDNYTFSFSSGSEVFDTYTLANSNVAGSVYDGYMQIRALSGATNAYVQYIEIYGT